MPIDRRALKQRSQELIRTSRPRPILVGLVYSAVVIVIYLLSAQITMPSMTEAEYNRFMEYWMNGNVETAARMLAAFQPSVSSSVVDFALQLCHMVISAGFTIFVLNTIRNTDACYGNLLDGFGMFFRFIWLNILESIFIGLWSMLFVIPGIIAAYRYRLAIYIMIDHPDMSALACIRESKRLMAGRKMELFTLDLSFIGWLLLSVIPVLGLLAVVWLVPYISITCGLYYDAVKNTDAARNTPPAWES